MGNNDDKQSVTFELIRAWTPIIISSIVLLSGMVGLLMKNEERLSSVETQMLYMSKQLDSITVKLEKLQETGTQNNRGINDVKREQQQTSK